VRPDALLVPPLFARTQHKFILLTVLRVVSRRQVSWPSSLGFESNWGVLVGSRTLIIRKIDVTEIIKLGKVKPKLKK
jgi:hypothetical protein